MPGSDRAHGQPIQEENSGPTDADGDARRVGDYGLDLGAAQFGAGAAVAPLVGALGKDELALALVMTVGMVIALLALSAVGVSSTESADDASDGVIEDVVPEPA